MGGVREGSREREQEAAALQGKERHKGSTLLVS